MINLPQLAQRLQDAKLMTKSFQDCTRNEILQVCEAVLSSIGDDVPAAGWDKPRIEDGMLRIPVTVHPRYRWWTEEGQSITETLIELDAPWDVAVRYIPHITQDEWLEKVLPF